MGLFSKKKTIKDIIKKEYKTIYFEECKNIWQKYVPSNGQASSLQGELLREIEKLRNEAQKNGNINWDDDFEYFCDFIKNELTKYSIYKKEEKEEIILIMDYIKECGMYAKKFNSGLIPDSEFDVDKIAYTYDNLYDIICDKIGLLQKEYQDPITYNINFNLKR